MNGTRGVLAGLVLATLLVVLGICVERFVLSADHASPPTYLELLRAELELRDDQVSAIAEILADEDADIEALRRQHIELLRQPVAERRSLTAQLLSEQLDAQQREHFAEL